AGDPFVGARLSAIESAVKQHYRTQGFATAEITSAVNEVGDAVVQPVISIKEGPRVTIGKVGVAGNQAVATERIMPMISMRAGDPYYGPAVARDRDAIVGFYLNEGYGAADVSLAPATPVKSGDGATADVIFKIVEGPQTIIEHIFITGNLRTKESVLRRELEIDQRQALGQAALTESRRRLTSLGLFRRIQISAVSHGDPALRDIVVAVEEAPQTSVRYGSAVPRGKRRRRRSATAAGSRWTACCARRIPTAPRSSATSSRRGDSSRSAGATSPGANAPANSTRGSAS